MNDHPLSPDPPATVTGALVSERAEEELLLVAESRRAQSDTFAWTVPGLATAAEAFVLTIALAPSTAPLGRLTAAVAGGLALFGAFHFINKQSYNFDLYDALIERQRQRLGRMSMYRETIERLDLPEHTSLKRRRRTRFTRKRGAVSVWRAVLVGLLAINLAISVYAVCEWAGADAGWLRSPPQELPPVHGDHRDDDD